jgi:hypothetical protein
LRAVCEAAVFSAASPSPRRAPRRGSAENSMPLPRPATGWAAAACTRRGAGGAANSFPSGAPMTVSPLGLATVRSGSSRVAGF